MNDLGAIRERARRELAGMAKDERAAGFGAPEDDSSGIDLIRCALDALAAHLADPKCYRPAAPDRMDCAGHALVMLETGLARLLRKTR